jgi:ParB family chromosome partitioning protein
MSNYGSASTKSTNSKSRSTLLFDMDAMQLAENTDKNQLIEQLPINALTPMDDQPRKIFEKETLEELAQSIRNYGILQPLIVTATAKKGCFYIIAGERRWRAAQLAGFDMVPCIVRDIAEHMQLEVALIENIQREELSPYEEACTLYRLIEEHEYTQEILASRIGKNRSTVANKLRLLNLPDVILKDLNAKAITAGHAKALCGLDDEKLQLRIHKVIVSKKLSVRQTEDLIQNMKKEKSHKKLVGESVDISADLRYICDQFKGHLGTRVKITGDTNKGKIEINYYTLDDLERISDLILNMGLK